MRLFFTLFPALFILALLLGEMWVFPHLREFIGQHRKSAHGPSRR